MQCFFISHPPRYGNSTSLNALSGDSNCQFHQKLLLVDCQTKLQDPLKPIYFPSSSLLVIGRTIVHINQLIVVVVIARTVLVATARLRIAIFLLHSLVFRATILEPHFDLIGDKQKKIKKN
jgi:hypothetical protein